MSNSDIPCPSLPDVGYRILRRIEPSRRPLLVSHIRLDGDAIGTELALAHMLRIRGASPHIVNDSRIPQVYQFLPGASEVGTSADALRDDYDLAIVLDIPTWERAREIHKRLKAGLTIVSVDHHLPMEKICDLEWVDVGRSSVGEMVYCLARGAGWRIPPEAATCLYTAIVTDTGRFSFPNTTASSLRVAAHLIELGADHVGISEKIYQEEAPQLLRLRGKAVEGLKFFAGGKAALMTLTRAMMEQAGVDAIDTQEMAEMPRALSGVVVGVLLREMTPLGKVKVSLRSRYGFDVEPIARGFGGGGHRQAAGCEISGDVASAEEAVMQALTKRLRTAGLVGET